MDDSSRDAWIAAFAARRWILVNSLGPDPHLERAAELYETMKDVPPDVAAEQDLVAHPENRWEADSGWSSAL